MYLTGVSNPSSRLVAREWGLGLMLSPNTKYAPDHTEQYCAWACDNGCYSQAHAFDIDRYRRYLARLVPYASTCRFITVPDVVGDARATIARAAQYRPTLATLPFPLAFVLQDGIERLQEQITWSDWPVLFVGGSTEWKLSAPTADLIRSCRARGQDVHMGRVNSERRWRYAESLDCTTSDGTFLAFGPDANLRRLRQWLGK